MQANYFDPFSVWKSFYSDLEPKMSQAMQKWLESDEYAAFSGQLLNATLQMEQQLLKTVEQTMQTYNIPTTKDIARLGELLVGLESKIDDLDERLIRLEQQAATHTADVREQLVAIAVQLDAIGKSFSQEQVDAAKQEAGPKSRKRTQKAEETADESEPGLV